MPPLAVAQWGESVFVTTGVLFRVAVYNGRSLLLSCAVDQIGADSPQCRGAAASVAAKCEDCFECAGMAPLRHNSGLPTLSVSRLYIHRTSLILNLTHIRDMAYV